MQKTKIVWGILIFVVVFLLFNFGEFEPLNQSGSKYLQALLVASAAVVSLIKPKLKLKLFYLSFLIFITGAFLYLTGKLMVANALFSAGLGIMLVVSLSYLPELLKKGQVENL